MKKIILFVTIIASLLIVTFSIKSLALSRVKGEAKENVLNSATQELSERLLKENIDKYQPKITPRTSRNSLELSAISAILVDENTGEIIYEKNINQELPPASITKVATFSVAIEQNREDDLIEISQKASEQIPNKIVMNPGEKLKLKDLLYGLMMISANDGAYAIAENDEDGFNGFIKKMNRLTKSLGLNNTNFKNPSGLDEEGHFSTAFDIATLTRYALLKHPSIIDYAGKKTEHPVYPSEHNESHWWKHISGMLYRYPGMVAAKTGYTEAAKSTFIGVAERNGRRLTVVFLGSTDANGDAQKLLDYGFSE